MLPNACDFKHGRQLDYACIFLISFIWNITWAFEICQRFTTDLTAPFQRFPTYMITEWNLESISF